MKTLVVETFYWNQTYSYVNAHQRSIHQVMMAFSPFINFNSLCLLCLVCSSKHQDASLVSIVPDHIVYIYLPWNVS